MSKRGGLKDSESFLTSNSQKLLKTPASLGEAEAWAVARVIAPHQQQPYLGKVVDGALIRGLPEKHADSGLSP